MSRFFARLALSIAALLVMLIAACMATGYFAYALYQFLAEFMSPALASLSTGFLLLLFGAAIVGITLWITTRPRSRRWRRYEGDSERAARETVAQLGGELGERLLGLAETHRTGALLAALVAGFAVGVSPKLREFLLDILRK
jgi:uncharacterized membrane protein YbhN (UPF0104 family)